MQTRRQILLAGAAATLAACGRNTYPTRAYTGPEVTRIHVEKTNRRLMLLHRDKVLKLYHIALGFNPEGHKRFEGDGRTPEGPYVIDRRNPQSKYHLALGISYPNHHDIALARAAGRSPGGDIFIHGHPPTGVSKPDWTWGCIAVTNPEIEEIYAMVRTGTPINVTA